MFYVLLSGTKLFIMAPPTDGNLMMLKKWQSPTHGREVMDSDFPAKLEGAVWVHATTGASVLIPCGWVHAGVPCVALGMWARRR